MTAPRFTRLAGRAVLAVGGEDRRAFLQGLISNDVAKVGPARAVHAAFLTAQGRFLHEFFVVESGESLLLEAEAERLDDLRRRLSLYRLRAKVTIESRRDALAVFALYGDGAAERLRLAPEAGAAMPFAGGTVFVDPRLPGLGLRALLPPDEAAAIAAAGFAAAPFAEWDALRLALGVPDGSRDLPVEKALPMENGFDELNGVDWKKGCYMGQELTARTKYRALVRKRLLPVAVEGPLPAAGTAVMLDGQEAGEMRSGQAGHALALLRLDAVDKAAQAGTTLKAGDALLRPTIPPWLKRPEAEPA
jgi:folate-binding protein YgfZ